ncbi:MAG: non-canonical purine pyrophosphatase [Candidatus Sulfotelmatobacter sp.]|nr:non-canonical purine pyrophosphatase [Candidatus Sulfotelmatobacter sp.]
MTTRFELRFVSGNQHKLDEARTILEQRNIIVSPVKHPIEELQIVDTERLVKDKALKAFDRLGEPLFVEHTGLYLKKLNGFPGGLTQIFWDTLQADQFAKLFGETGPNQVKARTVIGYIDGKRFHLFEGEIEGTIAGTPRGNRDFQWDCVFVPDGYDETFAELGDLKNQISMRKRALDSFAAYLESVHS